MRLLVISDVLNTPVTADGKEGQNRYRGARGPGRADGQPQVERPALRVQLPRRVAGLDEQVELPGGEERAERGDRYARGLIRIEIHSGSRKGC